MGIFPRLQTLPYWFSTELFAIVDFRRFDAAKYEAICCDGYYSLSEESSQGIRLKNLNNGLFFWSIAADFEANFVIFGAANIFFAYRLH